MAEGLTIRRSYLPPLHPLGLIETGHLILRTRDLRLFNVYIYYRFVTMGLQNQDILHHIFLKLPTLDMLH